MMGNLKLSDVPQFRETVYDQVIRVGGKAFSQVYSTGAKRQRKVRRRGKKGSIRVAILVQSYLRNKCHINMGRKVRLF